MDYPKLFLDLIDSFKKLPGVGAKSAERMAFQVLNMKDEDIEKISTSILNVKNLSKCPICGNISENNSNCEMCNDSTRDESIICVVTSPKDVYAIEKMKEYHGLYHVLNGSISPTKNISKDDINIASLISRVSNNTKLEEVILATDLTMEGEITSMYISKLLESYNNIKVTRLAHGLPMGAMLDYADEMTLFKAFSNRKKIDN